MKIWETSATVALADACPIRGRTPEPGGGRKRGARATSRKIGISRRLPDRRRCEKESVDQFLLQRNDIRLRDAVVFPRSAPVLSVSNLHIFVRLENQNLVGRDGG